jgi:hypothetical protein
MAVGTGGEKFIVRETEDTSEQNYVLATLVDGTPGPAVPTSKPNTHMTYDAVYFDGKPVVAVAEDGWIHVYRLASGAWEPLGDATLNVEPDDEAADSPDLYVDATGGLWLAWAEHTNQHAPGIELRKWDGSQWQDVGTGLGHDGQNQLTAAAPSVMLHQGKIWLAFLEQNGSVDSVWTISRPVP